MNSLSSISEFFKGMEFAQPYYFLMLLLIIPVAGWQIWKRKKMQASMTIPTTSFLNEIPKSWKVKFKWIPVVLGITAYLFIVIALAKPQSSFRLNDVEMEGVDIVITLDISESMKAMDFKPNRLEACKSVAKEFIKGRPTDRIGLVLYAGEAYTQCPVTSDHQTLFSLLEKSNFNLVDGGTAIGDGLGTAINRLRESKAKSKIIILLSDGVNNRGYMDPTSSSEIAKNQKIKVYTIGCGSNGQALFPGPRGPEPMETEIDESLLQNIAHQTGGQYFRATNNEKLKTVYNEIDKMEKTILNEKIYENKADVFVPFLFIGLILLILQIIFKQFILKTNP
jgi:Ca-activated chloride channel homolog